MDFLRDMFTTDDESTETEIETESVFAAGQPARNVGSVDGIEVYELADGRAYITGSWMGAEHSIDGAYITLDNFGAFAGLIKEATETQGAVLGSRSFELGEVEPGRATHGLYSARVAYVNSIDVRAVEDGDAWITTSGLQAGDNGGIYVSREDATKFLDAVHFALYDAHPLGASDQGSEAESEPEEQFDETVDGGEPASYVDSARGITAYSLHDGRAWIETGDRGGRFINETTFPHVADVIRRAAGVERSDALVSDSYDPETYHVGPLKEGIAEGLAARHVSEVYGINVYVDTDGDAWISSERTRDGDAEGLYLSPAFVDDLLDAVYFAAHVAEPARADEGTVDAETYTSDSGDGGAETLHAELSIDTDDFDDSIRGSTEHLSELAAELERVEAVLDRLPFPRLDEEIEAEAEALVEEMDDEPDDEPDVPTRRAAEVLDLLAENNDVRHEHGDTYVISHVVGFTTHEIDLVREIAESFFVGADGDILITELSGGGD